MLSPSAAPRWKTTTSFFPWSCALVVCASTDRVRKEGTAVVPTSAIAPPFINARRVVMSDSTRPLCCRHMYSNAETSGKLWFRNRDFGLIFGQTGYSPEQVFRLGQNGVLEDR